MERRRRFRGGPPSRIAVLIHGMMVATHLPDEKHVSQIQPSEYEHIHSLGQRMFRARPIRRLVPLTLGVPKHSFPARMTLEVFRGYDGRVYGMRVMGLLIGVVGC